jgi:hypothetical protein
MTLQQQCIINLDKTSFFFFKKQTKKFNDFLFSRVIMVSTSVLFLINSCMVIAEPVANVESNNKLLLSITPYSNINYDDSITTEKADVRFSDTYTRLVIKKAGNIERDCEKNKSSCIQYGKRNWLQKLFSDQSLSFNLTANITVGSSFTASVPLASVDHITDENGEKFSRVFYHSQQNFPLFLIASGGSNSIVSANFALKAQDKRTSNASESLGLIQSVVKLVAPQSAVITTLTQQSTKDAATAIDKSVNQLFSRNISEGHWVESDIRKWDGKLDVEMKIPSTLDHNWLENGSPVAVGIWNVGFEDPYVSIFSGAQLCKSELTDKLEDSDSIKINYKKCFKGMMNAIEQAETEALLKPNDVLNFQIMSISNGANKLGTIINYLKQQDWWDKELQELAILANNNDTKKTSLNDAKEKIRQLQFEASLARQEMQQKYMEARRSETYAKNPLGSPDFKTAEQKIETLSSSLDNARKNYYKLLVPLDSNGRVGGFCRYIKNSISALKLNYVDAGIVVEAVSLGLTLPEQVTQLLDYEPECKRISASIDYLKRKHDLKLEIISKLGDDE